MALLIHSIHLLLRFQTYARVPKQRKASKKQARRSRVKYELQLRMEVVSVGCTCVRPTVIPQQ